MTWILNYRCSNLYILSFVFIIYLLEITSGSNICTDQSNLTISTNVTRDFSSPAIEYYLNSGCVIELDYLNTVSLCQKACSLHISCLAYFFNEIQTCLLAVNEHMNSECRMCCLMPNENIPYEAGVKIDMYENYVAGIIVTIISKLGPGHMGSFLQRMY